MTATGECGGGVAKIQRKSVVFSFPKFKIIPTQLDRSLDPCYNNDMLVNNDTLKNTQRAVLYTYDRVLYTSNTVKTLQVDRSLERAYNNDMLVNNNDPVITQDTLVLYVYDIEYC